ncbi:MAG: 2OG-Fe(II) oxygenase [Polyangiaceae bacterium]
MASSHLIVDRFTSLAPSLRSTFDERLSDPRIADGGRFVWDYWHIPGQYTHLRTPAYLFFPKKVYEAFHRELVLFGRRVLGCHDISPTWLSCYVDGCRQELHGDLPHGPFAFVFSLTNWNRRVFRGGETLMLRDDVLDYWDAFASVRSVEEPDIFREIEPRFNRLTVFDPRIPHGVRRVDGTHDPREGRLVIHGWFVQPRPFIEGPLPATALSKEVNRLLETMPSLLRELEPAGVLSLSISVDASGLVTGVKTLCDTLRVVAAALPEKRRFLRALARAVRGWRFARARGPSQVTLPLVFER